MEPFTSERNIQVSLSHLSTAVLPHPVAAFSRPSSGTHFMGQEGDRKKGFHLKILHGTTINFLGQLIFLEHKHSLE